MIVVDASLVVKWFVPEVDMPGALAFLETYRGELCAPDLLRLEVASAIVRQANEVKALRFDAEMLLDRWAGEWWRDVFTAYRIDERRLQEAGRTAIELGHPLPDCIYLALAMELDCDLATCDAKFQRKATRLWPRVRLLESYAA